MGCALERWVVTLPAALFVVCFSMASVFSTVVQAETACETLKTLVSIGTYIRGKSVPGSGVESKTLKYRVQPESDGSGVCSLYWNSYIEIKKKWSFDYYMHSDNSESGRMGSRWKRYTDCFTRSIRDLRAKESIASIDPNAEHVLISKGIISRDTFDATYSAAKKACPTGVH